MQQDCAIHEWTALLGSARVSAEDHTRDRYARSTQQFSTRPAAILFPENADEVREIVRIASKHGVPLYPISRGNNWGYGDACAATDNQVIVDLRGMNRIIEVNADLAYAVVEPGVTQQQMADYLAEHDIPLWLDATGAGPDASIVGNTLERGFGHSPAGDHFHNSAGYEIVLADARVLKTGFGHYRNAQAAYIFKPGIGPALDGIFTQSNLGIVTKMGVWLQPKPECLEAFAFTAERDGDIARVIDALRRLRMLGVIQSSVHAANDLRAISTRTRYPWKAMQGQAPLNATTRRDLRAKFGVGAWSGIGGIYGTDETVAAARKVIRREFKGFATVRFFNESRLSLAEKACSVLRSLGMCSRLREQVASARSVFDLLKGSPSPQHLRGAGWRSKHADKNADPLDNHWGFLWFSPVLPLTGAAAAGLMRCIEPIFESHGFEPLVTMTAVTPRALCSVITISYDKSNAEESRRAIECYNHVWNACAGEGLIAYRCGVQSMQKLEQGSETFWDVARAIKLALDPANIIAPGRYIGNAIGGSAVHSSREIPAALSMF